MPANKMALMRYRIIDKCLQNRYRKWTLANLIEFVSDALYEYEGITTGVSKRTIQLDIQNMRSDKLGYNAPIIVQDKKYYTYEEKEFSITNSPISSHDVDKLHEVVSLLKQFKEFNYFEDLSSLVARLEDKVISKENPQTSPIQFDKNKKLKGIRWITPLHQAIIKKTAIDLLYQSFKSDEAKIYHAFPYLLKEYNNRWYLLCAVDHGSNTRIFGLDRIEDLKENPFRSFEEAIGINIYEYFNDLIGISKSPEQSPIDVTFRITSSELPYLKTKPLHTSQKILEESQKYGIVQITVIWNYELEREFLGWGEYVKIISPLSLCDKIKKRLALSFENYG